MNLANGPDGCIWITDYYREIIEDYSAIPRHLQQQYGVYHGHDRGRIYRLIHHDTPTPPVADMSKLEVPQLGRECASPISWRRLTAQRLLVERTAKPAAPVLREILAESTNPSAIITALRTLDQLNALQPSDVERFIIHADPAVRIHALQLCDRWLKSERALLDTVLAVAAPESNPRVRIQFALSLGESRDPRAFAALTQFAREQLEVRWMDAAILSSIEGRQVDLLAELLRVPGNSKDFLPKLAQTIAARRDETDLGRTLKLLGYAPAETQFAVLDGLTKGRKNATRKSLADPSTRSALSNFVASVSTNVSQSALALRQTFVPAAADESTDPSARNEQVTDEVFRKYVSALANKRDLNRGHEIFLLACATCHRIGNEGSEVGPDLIGQLGMPEEALLKDILLPSERIRPGYETTQVRLRDNAVVEGLLKEDGATTVLLMQAGGVEQAPLRKDISEVRRLATSLMPPFTEAISPEDMASLLAWLRSNLGPAEAKPNQKK